MRLLFILTAHAYYSSELAGELAEAGHDVLICANDVLHDFVGSGEGSKTEDYRRILNPKVALEWISIPTDTNLRTLWSNLRSIAGMRRIIHDFRPDVIHIHDVPDYRTYAAVALRNKRIPLVLTVHDAQLHPGDSSNRWEFLTARFRRLASGIIVHGEDIKERLIKIDPSVTGKICIIPHGCYTLYNKFLPDGVERIPNSVLAFGRIRKYKGVDILIQSAPYVKEVVPDAKIIIAGFGPDWPRCKEMIQDPGMFVLHEGLISDVDTARLFHQCDVVVLPYVEASQSGVLTIAYAMGRPVIVSDVGSLPEVVWEGETGFVVPPSDPGALAGAIVKMLRNPETAAAMGSKAKEIATTGELSWKVAAQKTTKLYEQLLSKGTH